VPPSVKRPLRLYGEIACSSSARYGGLRDPRRLLVAQTLGLRLRGESPPARTRSQQTEARAGRHGTIDEIPRAPDGCRDIPTALHQSPRHRDTRNRPFRVRFVLSNDTIFCTPIVAPEGHVLPKTTISVGWVTTCAFELAPQNTRIAHGIAPCAVVIRVLDLLRDAKPRGC